MITTDDWNDIRDRLSPNALAWLNRAAQDVIDDLVRFAATNSAVDTVAEIEELARDAGAVLHIPSSAYLLDVQTGARVPAGRYRALIWHREVWTLQRVQMPPTVVYVHRKEAVGFIVDEPEYYEGEEP